MNASETLLSSDQPAEHDRRPRRWARHLLFLTAGLLALVLLVVWAVGYLRHGRYQVTTDDAYIRADNTVVAPKVGGYVGELRVTDNQPVRAGQVLARIDDRDLRAALDQAVAAEQAAQAAVRNVDAQVTAQGSTIREADAATIAAVASLGLARRNDVRRQKMAQTGYGSTEQADNAATEAKAQAAGLDRLRAAATASREQVGVLQSQRAMAVAQLAHARAARHQAELNLSYATVVAPVDGTVAARTVRVGQYVQAGSQLMAVVPLQAVYVVANYKETQLTRVYAGQPATVRVDAFPDAEIHAWVDTIAPASGMEFSLLPSDNATGNFTKIVQRVPVKIVFRPNAALAGRLRPGMSVDAAINTEAAGSGRPLTAARS